MSENKKELSEQELEQAAGGRVGENHSCKKFRAKAGLKSDESPQKSVCKNCKYYTSVIKTSGSGSCLLGENESEVHYV